MTNWNGIRNWAVALPGAETFSGAMLNAAIAVLLGLAAWVMVSVVLKTIRKQLATIELVRNNVRLFSLTQRVAAYGIGLLLSLYLTDLFHANSLRKLVPACFILLFANPVREFLVIILKYFEKHWVERSETKVDDIIFDLLNKFSGAIIFAVAIILSLDILGINVMPFIAGAGVAGVAVGFAAKDTLSNLIAGVLLLIDRPFEIGDRIEVWSAPKGSSSWGDVMDIGLRATKIKTTDNIVIVIPNNEIMKRDIVNYTLISSAIRVRINIGVAYDTDVQRAKMAIIKVAESIEWVSKEPPPKVVVRSFGESAIDLQLRVWVDDARNRMNTISAITDKVKSAFDAEGIEIPYPKRDIHIIQSNG